MPKLWYASVKYMAVTEGIWVLQSIAGADASRLSRLANVLPMYGMIVINTKYYRIFSQFRYNVVRAEIIYLKDSSGIA